MLVVLVNVVPCYFWLEAREGGWPHPRWTWLQGLGLGQVWGVLLGLGVTLLLGGLATCVPMKLGLRAFRKLEF